MPLRILSGRPRHLQVLVLSLAVLTVGVAAGFGHPSRPSGSFETAASLSGADEFFDVPPTTSPLAADPPTTAPVPPVAADPGAAPAPTADRAAEAAAPPATTPPAPVAVTPPAPPARPAAVAPKPIIPLGKGMWLYQLSMAEGGDAAKVVSKAKAAGLTHLYVRTGSTWDGFQNAQFLDQVIPAAHDAGLKVYGWDFPMLANAADDVRRAMIAVTYTAPGGHRLDGFAADIETATEGTKFSAPAAAAYGAALRRAVGPSTLLVAVVPNPTPQMQQKYNYVAVLPEFDAVAPMVYWLNREPGLDTAYAMHFLAQYGKPLMPIGQAYDGGPEGGRPGVPPPPEIWRFIEVSKQYGAVAVSFWSWQHANGPVWNAIKSAQDFSVPLVPKPKASS